MSFQKICEIRLHSSVHYLFICSLNIFIWIKYLLSNTDREQGYEYFIKFNKVELTITREYWFIKHKWSLFKGSEITESQQAGRQWDITTINNIFYMDIFIAQIWVKEHRDSRFDAWPSWEIEDWLLIQ